MSSPVRIAHINTEKTWRGGEQQVFSLIKGLVNRDQFNAAVVRQGCPLAKKLEALKIPLCQVRPWGEWDVCSAQKIRRFLRQHDIQVVHAHSSHAVALAALAAPSKLPIVMTRRVDFHLKKNIFSKWKHSRVKRFVAISEKVKDIMVMDGIPRFLIDIVPSGIDFDRFNELSSVDRSDYGLQSDDIIIGQIAALADHKDQITLLKALPLIHREIPKVHIVIVGEGEKKSDLLQFIQKENLSNYVHLLGFKPNALDYLMSFDVMCLSSKEEGLGTSLLDAMALRVPVVATKAGGIPEILSDGETGYLADVQNPSHLADKILEALKHGKHNVSMLEKAYHRAKEFDISFTVEKMLHIYGSIVNN